MAEQQKRYTKGEVHQAVTNNGTNYTAISLGQVYLNKPEIKKIKNRDGVEVTVVEGSVPLNNFGYTLSRIPDIWDEAKNSEVTWADITFWGNADGKGDGDRLARYIEKASNPKGILFSYIAGSVRVESYERKDGTKGHTLRISERAMDIAPRSGQNNAAVSAPAQNGGKAADKDQFKILDEEDSDLPF